MQNHRSLQERRKSIQQMFSGVESYRKQSAIILRELSKGNIQTIIDVVSVINFILQTKEYSPYAKLLTLRFIKEAVLQFCYGFMTLFNSEIVSILFEFAVYKSQSPNQQRGRKLFLNYAGKEYSSQFVETIGYSFHKFVLETFSMLNLWFNRLKFYQEQPFLTLLQQFTDRLIKMNVMFPSQFSYYQKRQFFQIYSIIQHQFSQQKINQFYQLLSQKLINPQHFRQMFTLVKNIIKSGDMYCVPRVIERIKTLILCRQEDKMNYMDLVHKLFMIGDIQVIHYIRNQLLFLIVKGYHNKQLPYYHSYEISSWGYLLQTHDLFSRYTQIFFSLSSKIKGSSRITNQLKKIFDQNCQQFSKLNGRKSKRLKRTTNAEQQLRIAIGELISENQISIQLDKDHQTSKELDCSIEKKVRKLNFSESREQTPTKQAVSSKKIQSKMNSPLNAQEQGPFILKKKRKQSCPNFYDNSIQISHKKLRLLTIELKQKQIEEKKLKSQIIEKQIKISKLKAESKKSIELVKFTSKTTKTSILKKKTLLLKNTQFQIGLITQCINHNLITHVYVTPFSNIWNFSLQMKDVSWLACNQSENTYRQFLQKNSQFIGKFSCRLLKYQIQLQFPELIIEYKKHVKDNTSTLSLKLPLYITKFCRQQPFNLTSFKQVKSKPIILHIDTDRKYTKNIQKLKKYFSKAVELDGRYVVMFTFEKSPMYLAIENKRISLLGNGIGQAGETLLKGFGSLLCE